MSEKDLRVDEAIAAYYQAREQGAPLSPEEWIAAHPDLADELRSFLDAEGVLRRPDHDATLPPAARPEDTPTVGPSSPIDPSLGKVPYFGDYELLREVARGGMGVVYRARQTSLNRVVALKMVLAGQFAGEAELKRFRAEAEAAANLDHPNICPIYEVGEHQGQQYYSMKLIDGGSLSSKVAELTRSPREAARLVGLVSRAVQHAHEKGILHRDLKPANVLVDESGTPYVTDFGLAKKVEGDAGLTQTGSIVGTPAYMPPEQAAASKHLTPAADVYSLGAILYECLAGEPPFRGPTPLDVVMQVMDRAPVPPRQINSQAPADLETIALKCLEKEPGRRYASAKDLADDLDRWLRGEPIVARPVGPVERAWRWCKRNPVVASLSALLAVLLVGTTVASVVVANRMTRLAADEKTARGQAEENEEAARRESERANQGEREARHNLYLAQMGQAHLAWKDGQVGRVRDILQAQAPGEGKDDFRGFEWHYLARLLRAGHAVPVRRPLPAMSVACAADGRTLAVATDRLRPDAPGKPTLTLHDPGTGKVLRTLGGYEGGGLMSVPVAFSPDGASVAAIAGRAVRLWDVATGKPRLTLPLKGERSVASGLAFSPDGRLLAATDGSALRVWEAQTGKEVGAAIKPHTVALTGVAFLPGGEQVVASSMTQPAFFPPPTLICWDVKSGKQVFGLQHPAGALAVSVSPDGKTIASVGGDFTVRLWDVPAKKERLVLRGHTNITTAALFADDGRRVISGSHDGTLRVWDAGTGRLERTLRGDTLGITALALDATPKRVWSASADGTARSWAWSQDQDHRTLAEPLGQALSLAFHPGGKFLACGSAGVTVWDLEAGKPVRSLVEPVVNLQTIAVAFSRDGTALATGSVLVKVWNFDTGQKRFGTDAGFFAKGDRGEDDGLLFGLAFSPDGCHIASAGTSGMAVRDAGSGKRQWGVRIGGGMGTSVAYSADGKWLAAGVGKSVKVWDASTREEVKTLPVSDAVMRVSFTGDGRLLAASNTVAVEWELPSGAERRRLRLAASDMPTGAGVTGPGRAAFSADGRRLAMAPLGTGTVGVWDTATGQQIVSLPGPGKQVIAVAFSPDGHWLAAAGVDSAGKGVVHVWDGRPL